jgi:MSHA pilin protein MshC
MDEAAIQRPSVVDRRKIVRAREQRGFTLVELIAVMVIIGILAVFAMPRFSGRQMYDDLAFYNYVLSTLRYAQKSAISQHQFVCATFGAGSVVLTYGPTNACASGSLATLGGAQPANSKFSGGAPTALSFDCLGRLRAISPVAASCSVATAIEINKHTITVVGAATPITVEKETGYVH